MATVIVYAINGESDGLATKRIVANIVQSYFDVRHLLDHLITLRASGGGNNYAAVAAAVGAANAADGQAFFNAVDTLTASMTTAHDAAAPLDQMRPV